MLILRLNKGRGRGGRKRQFLYVSQNEDETLLLTHQDGTPYENAGRLINQHGGILGLLVRCIEFDGTIEEYFASTKPRNMASQWDIVNNRWHEYLSYKKSLDAFPQIEENA
jgi:hypothetical protein